MRGKRYLRVMRSQFKISQILILLCYQNYIKESPFETINEISVWTDSIGQKKKLQYQEKYFSSGSAVVTGDTRLS